MTSKEAAEPVALVRLLGYSLILPAIWLSLGIAGEKLIPGQRLGIVGTALLYQALAACFGWRFASVYQRDLMRREVLTMTAFCAVWAIALESITLLSLLLFPEDFGMDPDAMDPSVLLFAIGFAVIFNSLFIFLSINITTQRTIRWRLARSG